MAKRNYFRIESIDWNRYTPIQIPRDTSRLETSFKPRFGDLLGAVRPSAFTFSHPSFQERFQLKMIKATQLS